MTFSLARSFAVLFFCLAAFLGSCKKDKDNDPTSSNPDLATVLTDRIEAVSYKTATVVSTVSKEGKSAVLGMGVAYGKNPNPTVVADKSIPYISFGVGTFTTELKDLEIGTTYYVRSYATNAVGTSYSEQKTFTTLAAGVPILTTSVITGVDLRSARGGGEIIDQGSSAIFERGLVWSTSPGPSVSSPGKVVSPPVLGGGFSIAITGLKPATQYFVRAYATNGEQTGYGNEVSFTTLPPIPPSIITSSISNILSKSASSGGTINDQGSSPVVESGLVWGTSPEPTISSVGKSVSSHSGLGAYNLSITGLNPSTQYYIRAYATNLEITGYGNELIFTTLPVPTSVLDVDGNVYPTVEIGSQIWMKDNLKTSKYRNGDPVETGLVEGQWTNTTTGAYAIYDNNAANNNTYGKLYNWYAVMDSRGLCPIGWHLPSDTEWASLENFLGGVSAAGGKMKSVSSLWQSPNTGSTDESGFSGLPGGFRNVIGGYDYVGTNGMWWSSTLDNSGNVWYRDLRYNNWNSLRFYGNKAIGLSVRCLKD